MNIFYLDNDPVVAARFHCDRHVVKMTLETAQMLSAAHWRTGYNGPNHVAHGQGPYRDCRSAKPTLGPMRWIMHSLANYRWSVQLGLALAAEYMGRYGKVHATQAVLEWLRDNEPALPDVGPTPFIPSDLPEYLVEGDPVATYRRYYIGDKARFATWPAGETPEWFVAGIAAGRIHDT